MGLAENENSLFISEKNNVNIAVYLPVKTLQSLKHELGVSESEIEGYITSLIERNVAERIGEMNSSIFTETETEELEGDLKGLGYI